MFSADIEYADRNNTNSLTNVALKSNYLPKNLVRSTTSVVKARHNIRMQVLGNHHQNFCSSMFDRLSYKKSRKKTMLVRR